MKLKSINTPKQNFIPNYVKLGIGIAICSALIGAAITPVQERYAPMPFQGKSINTKPASSITNIYNSDCDTSIYITNPSSSFTKVRK